MTFLKTSRAIRQMLPAVLMCSGAFLVLQCIAVNAQSGRNPADFLKIQPAPAFSCSAHIGDKVKATFVLKNQGQQTLELVGARSTCGCSTVITEFPINLRANESTTVTLNVVVGTPDATGHFVRSADVFVGGGGTFPSLVFSAMVDAPPSK